MELLQEIADGMKGDQSPGQQHEEKDKCTYDTAACDAKWAGRSVRLTVFPLHAPAGNELQYPVLPAEQHRCSG